MHKIKIFIVLLFLSIANSVNAEDVALFEIKIKNNKFEPSEVKAKEGQKIKLVIINEDETVEEFESDDLRREKIIPPGGKVNIILAPLKAGKYVFYGDFHKETAQGVLIIE